MPLQQTYNHTHTCWSQKGRKKLNNPIIYSPYSHIVQYHLWWIKRSLRNFCQTHPTPTLESEAQQDTIYNGIIGKIDLKKFFETMMRKKVASNHYLHKKNFENTYTRQRQTDNKENLPQKRPSILKRSPRNSFMSLLCTWNAKVEEAEWGDEYLAKSKFISNKEDWPHKRICFSFSIDVGQ